MLLNHVLCNLVQPTTSTLVLWSPSHPPPSFPMLAASTSNRKLGKKGVAWGWVRRGGLGGMERERRRGNEARYVYSPGCATFCTVTHLYGTAENPHLSKYTTEIKLELGYFIGLVLGNDVSLHCGYMLCMLLCMQTWLPVFQRMDPYSFPLW